MAITMMMSGAMEKIVENYIEDNPHLAISPHDLAANPTSQTADVDPADNTQSGYSLDPSNNERAAMDSRVVRPSKATRVTTPGMPAWGSR